MRENTATKENDVELSSFSFPTSPTIGPNIIQPTREKYRLPIGGSSGPSQPPIGAEPKIRAPPLATLIATRLSLVRGTWRVGVEGGGAGGHVTAGTLGALVI